MAMCFNYLIQKEQVKAKAEGHNEYQKDYSKSEEGLENVEEHDDVDPQERKLPDVP